MHRFAAASALLLGLFTTPFASAATAQPSCGSVAGNCPSASPCCSTYGQCGVGAYCMQGCDPRYSFDLNSCVPQAVCQNQDFKMTTTDDIADISSYLGDRKGVNWVSSGKPVEYNGNGVLLTMAYGTVGTLLSSVNYVWYGKISATLVTSAGAGVVTAFIMMSDVQDEIDYEFVGVDLQHGQTNYYSRGDPIYTNSANVSSPDTNTETHTYTIDWTQDAITWYVDGTALRTKQRSETWNATSGRWEFPQTPARVELSLWPAGLSTNAKGTVDWAGGLVDWNSPYMQNGYYYALVSDVSVECYPPPAGAQIAGNSSYVYTDRLAFNTSVKIVDDIVVLSSLYASGDNATYNPYGTSSPSSQPSDAPQTVPGVSGIGTRGDVPGGTQNPASGGSSGAVNGSNGPSTFSQGGNSGAYSVHSTGGSAFAVLVAVILGCFWL